MNLYHRTSRANAEAILREGFRDNTDYYLTRRLHTGVWFSNLPLDENEGACGDTLMCVSLDLSESKLARYEWVEDGKGNREWLIPARVVNLHGRADILETRNDH